MCIPAGPHIILSLFFFFYLEFPLLEQYFMNNHMNDSQAGKSISTKLIK